jgi:hypothetical protein
MSIEAVNLGDVRRTSVPTYSSGDSKAQVNPRGDWLVAQSLPERAELVRLGGSYSAQIPAASAFTLLITIPTTRAELALQNSAAAGSNVFLVIERFWVKAVTSMAAAAALTPLSQVVVAGTALVADNAAVLRNSLSGKSLTYGGYGTLCIASTATGCLTDKWNHHQSVIVAPTTNIAACVEVNCYGKYLIPPQGNFSMNAQESVSGGTAIIGVEWHEAVLVPGA